VSADMKPSNILAICCGIWGSHSNADEDSSLTRWHHVDWYVCTIILEQSAASIFRLLQNL